jgi:hypothetical protein
MKEDEMQQQCSTKETIETIDLVIGLFNLGMSSLTAGDADHAATCISASMEFAAKYRQKLKTGTHPELSDKTQQLMREIEATGIHQH